MSENNHNTEPQEQSGFDFNETQPVPDMQPTGNGSSVSESESSRFSVPDMQPDYFGLRTAADDDAQPADTGIADEPAADGGSDSEEPAVDGSHKLYTSVFDWVDSVVASVIIVVLLFTFIFRVVGIVGSSMNDTLFNGDRVIINNLFYTPEQGDIVVVSRNVTNDKADEITGNEPIIKRVIATEGQTVNVVYGDDGIGHVFVDGLQVGDSYIREPMRNITIRSAVQFPVTVPQGCIFVMGDNRNDSLDSRSGEIGDGGMIDTRYVLGHAVVRIYPFNEIGVLR